MMVNRHHTTVSSSFAGAYVREQGTLSQVGVRAVARTGPWKDPRPGDGKAGS